LVWEAATPNTILNVYGASRKDGGTGLNAVTPSGFAFNEWHFVAAVFDGSGNNATSRKVRLDNGTTYSESTAVSPTGTDDSLTIGSRGPYSDWNQFRGNVAHAAVWNKALSDAELLELYTNRPPHVSFVANLAQYYPFASGDLYNETINNYDLTSSGAPSYSSEEPTFLTKKLKFFALNSAANVTDIKAAVYSAPTGQNITGTTKYGEVASKTFESSLESGKAALKIPLSEIGNPPLAAGATAVAVIKGTSLQTEFIDGMVIEE